MGFFIEPESEKKAKAKQEKKGKSSKKRYVEEKKAEKKKQISEKKVKKPETTPIDDDAPEIVKSSEAIKSKNMNFSQKIVEVVGGKNLGSKEATFKPRDPRFDPFVHGETLSTTQFAKYYKHAIEHQESQYQQEKKNFDQNKNTMNPHEKQRTELRIQKLATGIEKRNKKLREEEVVREHFEKQQDMVRTTGKSAFFLKRNQIEKLASQKKDTSLAGNDEGVKKLRKKQEKKRKREEKSSVVQFKKFAQGVQNPHKKRRME